MADEQNNQEEIIAQLLTVVDNIGKFNHGVNILLTKSNESYFADKSKEAFDVAEVLLKKFDELYGKLDEESLYQIYQLNFMGEVRDMLFKLTGSLKGLDNGYLNAVTRIIPLATPILLYTQKDLVKFYWGGEPGKPEETSSNTDTPAGSDTDTPAGSDTDTPASPEVDSSPETPSPATETESPQTPSSEEADMIRLHGSFNPESSVDQKKLQMYRMAKQQVGPSASFSDLAKAAYKLQYGDTSKYNIEPTKSRRQKGTKSPTAPVTPGEPIYFVRVGPGNYRPAVNADLSSNQQLFVRNPNKLARTVYPFIKMQNAPVRRADLPRK